MKSISGSILIFISGLMILVKISLQVFDTMNYVNVTAPYNTLWFNAIIFFIFFLGFLLILLDIFKKQH